jgi:uncharacterized damage-inducible protein DinB
MITSKPSLDAFYWRGSICISFIWEENTMKIWACLLILVAASFVQVANAADMNSAAVTGFRADALADLKDVGEKVESLAAAIPVEKYSWSPGKGVRSAGEVFMHIAGGNYFVLKMAGVQTPAGVGESEDSMMKDSTDKAKVADALKQSISFLSDTITNTPDSDLDKKVKLFGQDMTMRGVLMLCVNHMHEHLGQEIAYARMNGITPPWSK